MFLDLKATFDLLYRDKIEKVMVKKRVGEGLVKTVLDTLRETKWVKVTEVVGNSLMSSM